MQLYKQKKKNILIFNKIECLFHLIVNIVTKFYDSWTLSVYIYIHKTVLLDYPVDHTRQIM